MTPTPRLSRLEIRKDVPTLVVDGKYRVLGRSYEDMLRITDALIARERAARGGTAP